MNELEKCFPASWYNLDYEEIYKREILEKRCTLTNQNTMAIDSAPYTGRSPKDRFIVKEKKTEGHINWGKHNQAFQEQDFDEIYQTLLHYFQKMELFIFIGYTGVGENRTSFQIVLENIWQYHFCKNMLFEYECHESDCPNSFDTDFTILCSPSFPNPNWQRQGLNSKTSILFHFGKKMAIITQTLYNGEIKKAIFTMMNYYYPLQKKAMTLHCSANIGQEKQDTALIFGLSGTGKTTLSADSRRDLIGDDEHVWDTNGVWNIEAGCYAKVFNLKAQDEPLIYSAIRRNALLENIVSDHRGIVRYDRNDKTENMRVSYPLSHLPNVYPEPIANHPTKIIFLTCDANGLFPPIAKLNNEQAIYHFLSGYTAKIKGTENHISTIEATFSLCYGAPFFPLHPHIYAHLFAKKIKKHGSSIYLVNTGWHGGPYGIGKRISLKMTRMILNGIFDNQFEHNNYTPFPELNLAIPNQFGNIGADFLHPWRSWQKKQQYDAQMKNLSRLFKKNMKENDLAMISKST